MCCRINCLRANSPGAYGLGRNRTGTLYLTGNETVHHAGETQQVGLEEGLPQPEGGVGFLAHPVVHVDEAGDEAVPEPHTRRRELVVDPGVHRCIIVPTVACRQGKEAEGVHELLAEDDGQPLVIEDVLILGYGNAAPLLVERLVVPVGMVKGQPVDDAVVLTHEDLVDEVEAGLLVHSRVPRLRVERKPNAGVFQLRYTLRSRILSRMFLI